LVYGPATAFALVGTIIAIPIIVVYMATCLAVPFFYQREHRAEFNIVRHVIIPVIPFIVLAIVLYFQFVPVPPPLNLAVPISAACLCLGIIVFIFLSLRAQEALARRSKVYLEE